MFFKQLITNQGIHCALKNEWLSEFLWLHVPSKNEPPKFYPRRHPKKYEWEPWDSGNIQHCTVSYNTSCNSDYNLTVQPNSDKYDEFNELTI